MVFLRASFSVSLLRDCRGCSRNTPQSPLADRSRALSPSRPKSCPSVFRSLKPNPRLSVRRSVALADWLAGRQTSGPSGQESSLVGLLGSRIRWWAAAFYSDVIQFVSLMALGIASCSCKMENGKTARFPYHCQAFHRSFVRSFVCSFAACCFPSRSRCVSLRRKS